ncbi:ABC transporter substrate-binding protein [Nocardiopsis changdeensis]|uniref:Spermidine/putrescine ABC transporter substrate-binding protein n=1 Tax=Nocardiopsis changdeensis TaxID=2831969 RepID=A0ABX8BIR6_9ACTN|nr:MULTISPECIES: spermidine/putrescine ABC transporter substrate-binding protein [Nocardiopsis]QUX22110.1 spermidine/putrescine ABC transporter substrate-binding protein [Nocardiopsis changdeensis]QYX38049.1 spermidine/putrescine ABC transporter substrate-binding protein [Nocardiopsis sp. MT53]
MNNRSRAGIDPALLRGLTRARRSPLGPPGLTRRRTLQAGGAAAAALALSACGVGGQQRDPAADANFWEGKERTGNLRWANWPLYMDSERTQIQQFTEATGIEVEYKEDVQEAASFFGQIQPKLAAEDDLGYDLIVLPNGFELAKLIELGYLIQLDHSQLPNFAEYAGEIYKNSAFDPGNRYTVPYASGITGIAYNPEFIDREITSIQDLWDPAFEGKVGMFSDPQEIANFGLLATGVTPADSTSADWEAAADRLREQRDSGIVRAYYDQDFIQPLTNGDLWITMAWSGDIYQQNSEEGTNLKFVIPEEGATLWTDNLMIPYTTQAPVDAIELMNFLYEPEIATGLTEYIAYISPVPHAQEVMLEWAAAEGDSDRGTALTEMAESPLVFPTEEDYQRLHNFVVLPTEEQDGFSSLFQAVTQS